MAPLPPPTTPHIELIGCPLHFRKNDHFHSNLRNFPFFTIFVVDEKGFTPGVVCLCSLNPSLIAPIDTWYGTTLFYGTITTCTTCTQNQPVLRFVLVAIVVFDTYSEWTGWPAWPILLLLLSNVVHTCVLHNNCAPRPCVLKPLWSYPCFLRAVSSDPLQQYSLTGTEFLSFLQTQL